MTLRRSSELDCSMRYYNADGSEGEMCGNGARCFTLFAEHLGVGGEVKFACVDGPDFDGHKVDYAELMNRNGVYREREAEVRQTHKCRLEKLGEELIK